MQLCLALKYCHDNKVLHLDIKTANVFLDANNDIKLGDFGMARNLENTNQCFNSFAGTPLYLPPEIINGQSYSFKADVWSLGVVLYEMAALKVPFMESSFPMLLLKICKSEPAPLSKQYSQSFRNFVGKMLLKDQNERPSINQLFDEPFLADALRDYQKEYEHLRNKKKLSNFKIDNMKLHEDFNNLRTNRMTVYSADAKKIFDEAQNAVKPSRFKNVENDVFSSAISQGDQRESQLIEGGDCRQSQIDGLPVNESVMFADSEMTRQVHDNNFTQCIQELNNPELKSTSDIARNELSDEAKADFAQLELTAQLKNTLLEEDHLSLNYSTTIGPGKKGALADQKKENPSFYNSYYKNSVYKPNASQSKGRMEIDVLNQESESLDQSEIRKQKLNDMFLNKMCAFASPTEDAGQTDSRPSSMGRRTKSRGKSNLRVVSVHSKFSAQKTSKRCQNNRENETSGQIVNRANNRQGNNRFVIFSKKGDWEKFELSNDHMADGQRLTVGKSAKLIRVSVRSGPNNDSNPSTAREPEHTNDNIPLSSIGINKLPTLRPFKRKGNAEVVDHASAIRRSRIDQLESVKQRLMSHYGSNFKVVYSVAKKFVQFFGIKTVEKNLSDSQKLSAMANQLDKNLFVLVDGTDRLVELLSCNIIEMKSDFP